MSLWTWLFIAVGAFVVVYFAITLGAPKDDGIFVLNGTQEGSKRTSSTMQTPRSFNEKEGATFTWTGWMYVKDFTTGFGERRRIFSKGDCPGVYLDSTSNSLIVVLNTYGVTPETILVPNIPALKWIHFALVVDQTAVSVYINGTLRIYHTLNQLPKQNDDSTGFGSNWNGAVGNVRYYKRSLTNAEVFMKSTEAPPPDLEKKPESGQYFDITWYTGRI